MKPTRNIVAISLCSLFLLLHGCSGRDGADQAKEEPVSEKNLTQANVTPDKKGPEQLPVRYQAPQYFADEKSSVVDDADEDLALKVGADIRSTRGPQPLWDILKRIAKLKSMSVSWASDVDQNLLVDVDISAEDDFFIAIDNLLRQVDYYHEVKGTTIVVHFKQTKTYHIPLPYIKSKYTYATGGNYLSSSDAAGGTEGTVKINSSDNEFDLWANISENLNKMLETWKTEAVMDAPLAEEDKTADKDKKADAKAGDEMEPVTHAARQVSQGGSYYTIDKNIGFVTVTAPRPVLDKVDDYFENLKTNLFHQVSIEAKIIEVYLQDNSRIGLDWSAVLKNFNITGLAELGLHGISDISQITGQVFPYVAGSTFVPAYTDANGNEVEEHFEIESSDPLSTGRFVSRIKMDDVSFSVMLNALNEQGDARVLSNPKITVMNGQPAMISVGKEISYIKTVDRSVDSETNSVSYTAEVDSIVEGVSLGVVASIVDRDKVVLNLTPITTDLVGDTIEYESFGFNQRVGVPTVQLREMNSVVEVRDGEMLVIGGLIDNVEGKSGKFLPILGSIPYVRYLFGYEETTKERRELVILLVPKII